MTRRPIIGVSSRKIYFTHNDRPYPRFGVAMNYCQAVEAAGGAPMILPLSQTQDVLTQLLGVCDGFLMTGGFDLEPRWYGEEPHPKLGPVNPLRDVTEMILTKEALERDIPIFAICRGTQVLNVAGGGTLWQDLEAQMDGDVMLHFQQLTEEYPSHSVDVVSGTWLHAMTGEDRVRTNSYHHQAIKRVADGFKVTATAPDGVVEGISSERHFFVHGVQWHPELTYHNLDFNLAMFRSHVEAAGQYHLRKTGQTVG